MYGFDLDGTLADTKFDIFNKAQLIAMYEKAPVLYKPTGKFVALTARGTDQQVKNATRLWLKTNFGNQCEAVYFASGSEEEKINYKANKVKELKLEGYVDGKVSTLELFKKFNITGIKLYKLNITTGEIKLWAEL
jgi:phosphoglycolate phosphatase-like HAD superfamily hydrolase